MCRRKKQQDLTAIIYDKRGRILSIGKNSYVKTHPLQAHHARRVGKDEKIFLHAEIAAIARCRNLDQAHKIAVMRFNADGEPVTAKPCEICVDAIRMAGIAHVEHT